VYNFRTDVGVDVELNYGTGIDSSLQTDDSKGQAVLRNPRREGRSDKPVVLSRVVVGLPFRSTDWNVGSLLERKAESAQCPCSGNSEYVVVLIAGA
jgi:hypothetical protein